MFTGQNGIGRKKERKKGRKHTHYNCWVWTPHKVTVPLQQHLNAANPVDIFQMELVEYTFSHLSSLFYYLPMFLELLKNYLLKKTHAPQCSLQHYLQYPGHGNKLNVHQQRNG